MLQRRIALLALPLILVAGCARMGGSGPPAPTALAFATGLEEAETAIDNAVTRMDGFERMAAREDAAIAFASRGRAGRRFDPAPAGAAEAAGRVLAPAFAAIGDYGHVLSQVASGQAIAPKQSAGGAELARGAEAGLESVRAASGTRVPAPVRTAGLAGIAALADLPGQLAGRGRSVTLAAMVAEAQPHLAAVTSMLRAVVGPEPGQGTRGAIRARREGLDAGQARFLEAIRADSRIGAGERYSIFRSVAEMRDNDPAQGNLSALIALLDAMEQAHASLGAESPDAAAKVASFEAAVDQLEALNEASRRG